MKAIWYNKYGSPEVLQIKEIDKPVPKENEVLVKIHATTVTAVDIIFREGKQFFARIAAGITKPKSQILGDDFAGVIESVGKEVTQFKEGDKVFGASSNFGTHAEYICLPENGSFVTMPENLTFEEAASIPYGTLTALPFLRDNGKIKKGQKVLVIGASGAVGSSAVQIAKYFETEVTGVCGNANVELVKSLGADKVIDYTNEDFTKNGEQYDIIFDSVGKSSFPHSKNSLKQNGIFLTSVIGFPILLQMLLTSKSKKKKAAIAFTGMRKSEDKIKDLNFIKGLIENKNYNPVIDRTYSIDQIAEAHSYVDNGHKKGNVVITLMNNN